MIKLPDFKTFQVYSSFNAEEAKEYGFIFQNFSSL